MTEVEALQGAVERVKQGWCQGEMALDSEGEVVWPGSPAAARWCLVGAVEASVKEAGGVSDDVDALLKRVRGGCRLVLSVWNDQPESTADDVIKRLESAI